MSLILTQLLKFLACHQLLAGVHYFPTKMCAELHKIVSCTGHRFPPSLLQFFFFSFMKAASMLSFFTLAYRTFHGKKRKNSILCVVNIITGPTKSFDRGIMGCLLLEASKLLPFSVNMLLFFPPFDPTFIAKTVTLIEKLICTNVDDLYRIPGFVIEMIVKDSL